MGESSRGGAAPMVVRVVRGGGGGGGVSGVEGVASSSGNVISVNLTPGLLQF